MADEQMSMFQDDRPDRVIIEWMYHDAGYFWTCPMCEWHAQKRPVLPYEAGRGTPTYELKTEMECRKCRAQFKQIPGDVDNSDRLCVKYGYLLLNG